MVQLLFPPIYNDVAEPWQLGFQDSAAPGFDGIVELHDSIFFFLVLICVGVSWMLFSIMRNFGSTKNSIVYKYLNHGKNVPINKYSNIKLPFKNNEISIRTYSTQNTENLNNKSIIPSVKFYDNAHDMKKDIISENKSKAGIYMWKNLLTGDIYIGQSKDLSKRLRKYFTLSYLKSKETLIISRALIKYGYINFSLSILEYCDTSLLLEREQYYLDKLQPQYNILKLAGSSSGYKHTPESKAKRSKALKGVYVGTKSALFGTKHNEETIEKMRLSRGGENNYFYGKTHNEKTIELMRGKALNRKHMSETKDKISQSNGNPVNIYEKCSTEEFKLIGSFVSVRRAAKFLDISGSTILKYMNSGQVFKERYKFSSK